MRHVLCVLAVVLASSLSQARAELLHVSLLFEKGDSLLPSGELQIGEVGRISVFVRSTGDNDVALSGFTLDFSIEPTGATAGTGRQLWFYDDQEPSLAESEGNYVFYDLGTVGLELKLPDPPNPPDPPPPPPPPLSLIAVDSLEYGSVDVGSADLLLARLKIVSASDAHLPMPGDTFRISFRPDNTDLDPSFMDEDFVVIGSDPADIAITMTAVPEPSSLVLLTGMGLSMLVWHRRRRGCR